MRILIILSLMILAACGGKTSTETVPSSWALAPEKSEIVFGTTKNSTIVEHHNFLTFTGAAKDDKVSLLVDLNSVATNIDKRDERMRTYLFETDKYPKMTISADVMLMNYHRVMENTPYPDTIDVIVNLHGIEKTYAIPMNIVRGKDQIVTVSTQEPLLVRAQDFGLVDGVSKLKELAKLDSISLDVPVSFSLVFTSIQDAH